MASADFWSNRERAQGEVEEVSRLRSLINPLRELERETEDFQALQQLATEEADPLARATADKVTAKGVSIATGALFTATGLGTGVLTQGTVFTVMNNTAATPIAGMFSNLPDGSTFPLGGNNFQANYEGGDGNDLTLTVVP